MIYLSVFVPLLWCVSFLVTRGLGQGGGGVFFLLFAPNVAGSALLSKWMTMPFRAVFRKMDAPGVDDHMDLAGMECRVLSLSATEAYGQAEVLRFGAPFALNVRTLPGASIPRGAPARVVGGPDEKGVYMVEPVDR